ncbi:hypothetical protein [Candidatus Pelagibacter communis]|uniref:hypothetical protein n=1 Tax=Pelagibacter ubique TaxID=198252 RepID=UPI00094D6F32|nr:hypothetical protein [Candidatus Pelagibacter ubique]
MRTLLLEIKGARPVPVAFKSKLDLKRTLKNAISKKDYNEDKRRFNIFVNCVWNVGRGFWASEEVSSGMLPNVVFKPTHKVEPLQLPLFPIKDKV